MRGKKAAIGLSINAIIILILAIVILGLALGFIRGMFGKVSVQVEEQIAEPEPAVPTAFDPITLSRETIITHAGNKEVMKVSTFNPTDETWLNVKPELKCEDTAIDGIKGSQSANRRTVEQGKFETFNLLLTIPFSGPNTYLCQMGINSTDVDIIIDYKKDMTIKIIQ